MKVATAILQSITGYVTVGDLIYRNAIEFAEFQKSIHTSFQEEYGIEGYKDYLILFNVIDLEKTGDTISLINSICVELSLLDPSKELHEEDPLRKFINNVLPYVVYGKHVSIDLSDILAYFPINLERSLSHLGQTIDFINYLFYSPYAWTPSNK